MERKEHFPEQTAPDKNTDRAFVKVAKDGSPVLPGNEKKEEEKPQQRKPAAEPKK